METNQKNGTVNKRIYFSIIVVLLFTNTFTLYTMFNERAKKEDVTSEKIALQSQFEDLSDTLNMRSTELEQFIGKNAELDKTIAIQKEEMETQRKKIVNLLAKNKLTQAELVKARNMIAEYKASISDLSARVEQLTRDNEQLVASNLRLSSDLTSERTMTAQLSEQNKGLSKKVEVGSLLPVAKVEVDAVKTRSNGKEVEVRKAKAASNLRISFETGENKVLDPGQISLYVRIINPKGETIAVADQGSGTLQTVDSPEPVIYTKKADIDYNQTNKKVVVYWGKNIQEPGIYKVELYQAGYVIGQGEVKLS